MLSVFSCYTESTFSQFKSNKGPVGHTVAHFTTKGKLSKGFTTNPTSISFGVLKDGCIYKSQITLQNVGIDTCHFKIVQPPPSTGISLIYTPGFVSSFTYLSNFILMILKNSVNCVCDFAVKKIF